MFWQSGDPRNSTHFAAAGLFFEPTQMESARPLYMLARLPLGRLEAARRRSQCPWRRTLLPIFHEPLVIIAYLPAAKMSDVALAADCGDRRHVALLDQRAEPLDGVLECGLVVVVVGSPRDSCR